jgi:hypothetical protein
MQESVQYITNEIGERIGVLLDLQSYKQLTNPSDAEYLRGLSFEELQALAESRLAPQDQTNLNALLERNTAGELNSQELATLDRLLNQVDQLTLLKTRANYTLFVEQMTNRTDSQLEQAQERTIEFLRERQSAQKSVNNLELAYGKWPGEETDEQIEAALEELS